ncbi:MAG TPA: family 16 glycoside hydrolase [Thermodesulfovibrionia bacterium]|nr:family 16 glycoside hydrolase [Thermodesulfovibrionia bacterium]
MNKSCFFNTIAAACAFLVFFLPAKAAFSEEKSVHKSTDTNNVTFDFEDTASGQIPEGWIVESTGQSGPIATWQVVFDKESESKVLGMTKANHNSDSTFNICRTKNVNFKDGEIEVRFKAIEGKEDQGGGPVWRLQDKDNYYIARANPLENNFRLYYVKNGERTALASADVDVPSNKWHTIKIIHKAEHIEAYLNRKKYLEAKDSTFNDAGKVGLWTKADAVTDFDDFKIKPLNHN